MLLLLLIPLLKIRDALVESRSCASFEAGVVVGVAVVVDAEVSTDFIMFKFCSHCSEVKLSSSTELESSSDEESSDSCSCVCLLLVLVVLTMSVAVLFDCATVAAVSVMIGGEDCSFSREMVVRAGRVVV